MASQQKVVNPAPLPRGTGRTAFQRPLQYDPTTATTGTTFGTAAVVGNYTGNTPPTPGAFADLNDIPAPLPGTNVGQIPVQFVELYDNVEMQFFLRQFSGAGAGGTVTAGSTLAAAGPYNSIRVDLFKLPLKSRSNKTQTETSPRVMGKWCGYFLAKMSTGATVITTDDDQIPNQSVICDSYDVSNLALFGAGAQVDGSQANGATPTIIMDKTGCAGFLLVVTGLAANVYLGNLFHEI